MRPHRTHTPEALGIEVVTCMMERTEVEQCIRARITAHGICPQCASCGEKCKMPAMPFFSTAVECFLHPGPMTINFWHRRLRESRGKLRPANQRGMGALRTGDAPSHAPSAEAEK